MDQIWDFMQTWTFMIIMGVVLLALIGVFVFLRMRKTDD